MTCILSQNSYFSIFLIIIIIYLFIWRKFNYTYIFLHNIQYVVYEICSWLYVIRVIQFENVCICYKCVEKKMNKDHIMYIFHSTFLDYQL